MVATMDPTSGNDFSIANPNDASKTQLLTSLKKQLLEYTEEARSAPSSTCFEILDGPDPGLHLTGIGDIKLPLSAEGAYLIADVLCHEEHMEFCEHQDLCLHIQGVEWDDELRRNVEKVGRDLDIPGVIYARLCSVQLMSQQGAIYEVPCGCITSSQGDTASVIAKLNVALPSKPDGEGRFCSYDDVNGDGGSECPDDDVNGDGGSECPDNDVDDDVGSECSYYDLWEHSPLGYSYTASLAGMPCPMRPMGFESHQIVLKYDLFQTPSGEPHVGMLNQLALQLKETFSQWTKLCVESPKEVPRLLAYALPARLKDRTKISSFIQDSCDKDAFILLNARLERKVKGYRKRADRHHAGGWDPALFLDRREWREDCDYENLDFCCCEDLDDCYCEDSNDFYCEAFDSGICCYCGHYLMTHDDCYLWGSAYDDIFNISSTDSDCAPIHELEDIHDEKFRLWNIKDLDKNKIATNIVFNDHIGPPQNSWPPSRDIRSPGAAIVQSGLYERKADSEQRNGYRSRSVSQTHFHDVLLIVPKFLYFDFLLHASKDDKECLLSYLVLLQGNFKVSHSKKDLRQIKGFCEHVLNDCDRVQGILPRVRSASFRRSSQGKTLCDSFFGVVAGTCLQIGWIDGFDRSVDLIVNAAPKSLLPTIGRAMTIGKDFPGVEKGATKIVNLGTSIREQYEILRSINRAYRQHIKTAKRGHKSKTKIFKKWRNERLHNIADSHGRPILNGDAATCATMVKTSSDAAIPIKVTKLVKNNFHRTAFVASFVAQLGGPEKRGKLLSPGRPFDILNRVISAFIPTIVLAPQLKSTQGPPNCPDETHVISGADLTKLISVCTRYSFATKISRILHNVTTSAATTDTLETYVDFLECLLAYLNNHSLPESIFPNYSRLFYTVLSRSISTSIQCEPTVFADTISGLLPCTCRDCIDVNDFLESRAHTTKEMLLSYSRSAHLQQQVNAALSKSLHRDILSVKNSIAVRDQVILTLRKTAHRFNKAHSNWDARYKNLKSTMSHLEEQGKRRLEQILGPKWEEFRSLKSVMRQGPPVVLQPHTTRAVGAKMTPPQLAQKKRKFVSLS